MTEKCIPVVPAQHYFMGGIKVNYESKTSMDKLYAVGETACNGVHGRNRLASNSLLESLVFAKRAAQDLVKDHTVRTDEQNAYFDSYDAGIYTDDKQMDKEYKAMILSAIAQADEEKKGEEKHV